MVRSSRKSKRAFRCSVVACVTFAGAVLAGPDISLRRFPRQRSTEGPRLQALPEEDTAGSALSCDQSLPRFYGQTPWPGIHRDAANSDFAPFVAPQDGRVLWTALDGAAVLAHPTLGPEGNVYVTTGQGPGTSHLHVFDRDGLLLWESAPQATLADLDSGAAFNAAIVDRDGDVYLTDSDQFWSFHPNGEVKWVVDLPTPGNFIPGAVISNEGFVGGMTVGGEVLFLNREDGSLAVPVFDLPGGAGPPSSAIPPGLWEGGLLDPEMIQVMYETTFGFNLEVANTPAIHPQTGRMYITAAGSVPTEGVLYALDIVNGAIEVAFQTPLGGGSGSSPAISGDGSMVFAVGGDGVMVALDVDTGAEIWSSAGAGSATSPAIGPDGTIFTGSGEVLLAVDPADGSVLWQVNYDALAAEFLPRKLFPSLFFPTGIPIARTDGVVSISAQQLWVPLALGYDFGLPGSDAALLQAHVGVVASIDPADGRLLSATVVRDTVDGTIAIGSDGRVYVRHGAILSSIFYYGINPLLPSFYDAPGPPIAGLSVIGPSSFVQHAARGVDWMIELGDDAVQAVRSGESENAMAVLCRGLGQVAATRGTIATDAASEIGAATVGEVDALLNAVGDHFATASSLLPDEPSDATSEIILARTDLAAANRLLKTGGSQDVQMDIVPGACPNVVRLCPSIGRTVDVVVIGSSQFDASEINAASLRLARTSGIGGEVAPVQRFRAPQPRLKDLTSPSSLKTCDCSTGVSDGIPDLVVPFSVTRLAITLKLGRVVRDSNIRLTLRGALKDGTPFEATDCIVIP